MSGPAARDLFLQLWATGTNEEHAHLPGSAGWAANRKALTEHWARAWADCVDLAARIEQCEVFAAFVASETAPGNQEQS